MKNLILTLVILALAACSSQENKQKRADQSAQADGTADLQNHSNQVLEMLVRKDFKSLSGQIEPGHSLLFSPYATIDTASAMRLSVAELAAGSRSKEVSRWGDYDGTGEPIQLTLEEYFDKFVNDKAYSKADSVLVNSSAAQGNSTNNLKEVFPGCEFVEYYHKGTEQYSGMDWGALRLVFKTKDGKTYLVAVVHDQWTS